MALTCTAIATIACDGDPCRMTPEQRSKVGDNGEIYAAGDTLAEARSVARALARDMGWDHPRGTDLWFCVPCQKAGMQ